MRFLLVYIVLILSRPKSKYADWEEPPQEGEIFNYDAVPERFYFEVESIGNLEPDAIIQQGIKVLQQKLASVIRDLTAEDDDMNGYEDGPRSPDVNPNNGPSWGQDQGYTTPYGNGGAAQPNQWNAGSTTPFGATPYGQNGGSNGWGN